jgi:hypothetical protein
MHGPGIGGYDDEMYVVGHEAIGKDFDAVLPCIDPQQPQIEFLIPGLEEDALAMVAALRDVVRNAR